MVKIFTSALWWNAVNRPKRRGRRNVFSSIFGSSNNGINKGWGSVSWKERNPLARKIESSFENFLISGRHCLSASEYASSSIICVGNMQTISSLSLKTGLQSSITSSISTFLTELHHIKPQGNVVLKGNGFWAISLNLTVYISTCILVLIEDRQHEHY